MKIFICGDSTAASYAPEDAPLTGWGQMLGDYVRPHEVRNLAFAGRSSKSFLYEGRLQAAEGSMEKGDLVLIQFTHNDASALAWRHTEPWTGFQNCLRIYVDTARLHGARPVLLTPLCLRNFEGDTLLPSHGDYPEAVRVLARQTGCPLVDLYALSHDLVQSEGVEGSRKLFLHTDPGLYARYPDGSRDDAHTQKTGADRFAQLVAGELARLGLTGQEDEQ